MSEKHNHQSPPTIESKLREIDEDVRAYERGHGTWTMLRDAQKRGAYLRAMAAGKEVRHGQ